MTDSQLISGQIDTDWGGTADYKVLLPAATTTPLPLILHLHGAMSSAASLEAARPAYEEAWAEGHLPPALVACVSTPTEGGFYMDFEAGPKWETLVGGLFPQHLEERHALNGQRAALGFSMGGYGALKLALRNPATYHVVAALCPVIFPAETAQDVPERNRPAILDQLNRAMGENQAIYRRNSVYGILRENLEAIRSGGPDIFVDCGDADEFGLHDGAVYLHKLLNDLDVSHIYRSIGGAGHADDQAPVRQAAAIAFIGKSLAAAAG